MNLLHQASPHREHCTLIFFVLNLIYSQLKSYACGVMHLDQFSSPIILLDLQYPVEADSSEEGMQFAIRLELGARYREQCYLQSASYMVAKTR